jgi:lysophospholipase L1-like esterase
MKSQDFSEYPFQISDYYFVNYDSNEIKYFGDNQQFDNFYSKLENLFLNGENQINIVQIGGSHIQADVFTAQIRNRFQNVNGGLNAGRGMLFPYRLARTNTPYGYHFDYSGSWDTYRNVEKNHSENLGITGITAITNDTSASLTLMFKPEFKEVYKFNSMKIFHKIDSFSFYAFIDSSLVDSVRVSADSTYSEYFFNSYVDSLKIDFRKTDSIQNHFELYGILPQTDDAGVIVHNIGINGASVPSFLRCNLIEDQLKVIQPDLIIFGLGINDAYGRRFSQKEYENNYKELVRRIKTVSPETAFIYLTNNDSYLYRRYVNRNGIEVQESIYKLAQYHNAGVWDLFEIMGGLNSVVLWERAGLSKRDKVHFTRTGYILIGDLLFDAMMKSFGDYLAGQSFKYNKTIF